MPVTNLNLAVDMGNEQSFAEPGATDLTPSQAVALWLSFSGYRHEFQGRRKDNGGGSLHAFDRYSIPWGAASTSSTRRLVMDLAPGGCWEVLLVVQTFVVL